MQRKDITGHQRAGRHLAWNATWSCWLNLLGGPCMMPCLKSDIHRIVQVFMQLLRKPVANAQAHVCVQLVVDLETS